MDLTRTAFGTWSGGRYMHFGEALDEERYCGLIRTAYDQGTRTFITADVYGNGAADEMLGRALAGLPRNSYCLVGTIGHNFYTGRRSGSKGYPRFTDPTLRNAEGYAGYLRMATERSLARCGADRFDLVMLHNPDSIGYTSDDVWTGMVRLKESGLANRLGVAPGPANGFTLDLILCFEKFGSVIDWAMIILNPLEPWPGNLSLSAARKHEVKILTRVVDHGGLFHDDVKPGHVFAAQDHRAFRPAGWVEAGCQKIDRMHPFAQQHGISMLQLACAWNLAHAPVESVVPTLIQELGPNAKPIERKVEELAALPDAKLTEDECRAIFEIGNNKGCMALKGANRSHKGPPEADHWGITKELEDVAKRWGIDPDRDLVLTHH